MTPNEKISLFCSFFRGREDAYAVRWEGRSGAGYRPVFDRFSPSVARRHLRGEIVAGIYPLLPDNTTWFLAIDFDGPEAAGDALSVMKECQQRELPALLERSRSGVGFHVWLFFEEAIAAERARKLGQQLILENGRIQVLVATAALVGEGWDCPSLSALFLSLPMGRSSRLDQLAGRLTRPDPDKPAPVLHDYFDENVQVLKAMFHRRLKTFRRLLGDERLPPEFRSRGRKKRAEVTYADSPPRVRKSSVRESEGQLYLFE